MITSAGKQIIGRFLVGQTDSYASYLAVGCGPKPLATTDSFGSYASKKSLDFEMFRAPIISKNIITENNVTKVVLTAELPSDSERYAITEIGVYPSLVSPTIVGSDSKFLALFSSEELWKYHSGSITDVPIKTGEVVDGSNNINVADNAFFTTSEGSLFENLVNTSRIARYEQPRFLNSTLLVRGDTSTLTVNGNDLSTSGNHIHLGVNNFGIAENSFKDEIKLAFSVVNKDGTGSTDVPSNVKISIQFATTDGASPEYSSLVVNLNDGVDVGTQTPTGTTNITFTTTHNHNISVNDTVVLSGITPSAYNGTWTAQSGTTGSTLVLNIGSNPGAITVAGRATSTLQHNFKQNRYVVVSKSIESLYKTSSSFSWEDVSYIKIFVDIEDTRGSAAAGDFYVALDALRLENISSFNNKYGLSAYTVLKTSDILPIVKAKNTTNFIEFKYVLDVV